MVAIRNFTPRLYQETIMASCAKGNCLIILPTGLGKTKTAILAIAQRLNSFPNSKILFLTVTKPLAEQIHNEVKECLDIGEDKIVLFTGSVAPKKREELWSKAAVVVSTPQCVENDVINSRMNLEDVSLLIADEAHNAVKDYSYTWVGKQYRKKSRFPRIIGLTASPGSDLEKIQEVCKNLYIEEIEIRTDKDPDVKPYVYEIDIKWVPVELSKVLLDVSKYLQNFLKDRLERLKKWGILRRTNVKFVSKTDLLGLQAQLRGRVSTGERDFVVWNGISVLAEIMKIHHALELLETQGIIPLYKYMSRFNEDAKTTKVKAVKNIVKDLNFRSAFIKVCKLYEEKVEHPKLIELQKIVEKEIQKKPENKIIVFNQFRDSASDIAEKLNTISGINAKLFVGQVKKGGTGLSQKEQKAVLDEFRAGMFNVLVATSIGEQGLDIPQVDTVVFYEPIPSAIRQIQRRGRTGRHDEGKVIVLMTKNTMDEGYRWSAHHKEKRMYRNLENLKGKLALFMNTKEEKITSYMKSDKVKIFADHREKGSGILKELIELEVELKMEALPSADYILSSRVGVEVKTVGDFVESIIDGRLLQQIKSLKNNFERPLLVIEGIEDIYSVRNVHANAIRGMLAAITVSYGVPILYTKNFKDSAMLLNIIAKREQEETGKDFSLHPEKKAMSIKDQQEYIISSLPGVGAGLAKPLLKHFKSVKNVINAEQKELEKVEKIGKKKGEKIKDIVDREYQEL
ncbi:DEAD/DEAH box helicase [Candidatus Woesearchaeota archaeon]|nr:DEAD/DEAH box helicase [Candidatus Woesearchaeota archaeon]|tara:strand:+ start:3822 stop:6041 length:2220 start_codon:yes stop_codon:yes gene_type:complete